MKDVTLEVLIKSLINDFRDYQKEWLTSHNDIEFDRPEEDLILAFLDDTAYCYISEQVIVFSTRQKVRDDMNKNITHYCAKCGKITKWRKKNSKGKWYCTQCKAERSNKE